MEWLSGKKEEMRKIYNFNLMKEGGHISGWLVSGKLAKDFEKKINYWMSFKKHVAPRMDIQYNGIRKSAKVFFI